MVLVHIHNVTLEVSSFLDHEVLIYFCYQVYDAASEVTAWLVPVVCVHVGHHVHNLASEVITWQNQGVLVSVLYTSEVFPSRPFWSSCPCALEETACLAQVVHVGHHVYDTGTKASPCPDQVLLLHIHNVALEVTYGHNVNPEATAYSDQIVLIHVDYQTHDAVSGAIV